MIPFYSSKELRVKNTPGGAAPARATNFAAREEAPLSAQNRFLVSLKDGHYG
jgi:hypothetical protein